MAERDVTIRTKVDGSQQTADDLRRIKNAAGDIGEGFRDAEDGAQDFDQASQRIQETVDLTVDAVRRWVAEAENVDQITDDVKRQEDTLIGLRNTLDDTVKFWSEFGDEGKEASEVATEGLKTVTDKLTALRASSRQSTDTLKAGFRDVADEARDAGDAIQESGRVARSGYERVDAAVDRVRQSLAELENRFATGQKVEVEHIDKVISAQIALEYEIRRTGRTVEDLGGDFQNAFSTVSGDVDKAKDRFREYNKELREHRQELQVAGEQWTGLDNAIQKAAGSAGFAIGRIGLFTAALTEGLRIGRQFAEGLGTNFKVLEEEVESFRQSGAALQDLLGEINGAFINTASALASLDFERASESFKEYSDLLLTGVHRQEDLGRTLADNKDVFDLLNVAIEAGIPLRAALNAEESKLLELQRLMILAREGGAESEKILQDAIAKSKGSLEELVISLKASETALNTSAEAAKRASEAHGTLSERIAELVGNNKNLQEAYQKSAELAGQQEPVVNGLTDSMRKMLETVTHLVRLGPEQNEQVRIFTDALENETDVQQGLTEEQKKHVESIIERLRHVNELNAAEREALARDLEQATALERVADATQKVRIVRENGRIVLQSYREEEEKVADATEKVATASGEAAPKITTLGDAAANALEPLQALASIDPNLAPLASALDTMLDRLKSIKMVALEAADAINKMGEAGLDGTEDQEG